MNYLIAQTEPFVLTEKTYFSDDEAVGQNHLSVENAQGFAVDDYVILGKLGYEKAEMGQISEVASDLKSITLNSATKHAHDSGEPIQKILFNKRKFYRSTSKTGTYTHLSTEGSPVSIEVDEPEGTHFEDTSGTSTSWYKATYYNSTSKKETNLEDAQATQAGEAEHYSSIYKIKVEAGLQNNPYIMDDLVDSYRLEAEAEINGMLSSVYSLPLSSIPKLIEHICRLLAAGLLLSREYGMEADVEISKTGERKILRAQDFLNKITNGSLRLIDSSGTLLSRTNLFKTTGSNIYDGVKEDLGEMFNLADEKFKMTDPDKPTSPGKR